MKNFKSVFVIFSMLALFFNACGDDGRLEVLPRPALVSVDSTNGRVFIVDTYNNVLSLILTATDRVLNDEVLLDADDATINLPRRPSAVLAIDHDAGNSRLFIASSNSQIIVLDYDGTALSTADISPITLGTETDDIISALAYDATNDQIFAANASDDKIYVLDPTTGAEVANSPIDVGESPNSLAILEDENIAYVVVGHGVSEELILINANDLTVDLELYTLGTSSHGVALAKNNVGSVLSVISQEENQIYFYRFNTDDFENMEEIETLSFLNEAGLRSAVVIEDIGDLEGVEGLVSHVTSGNLADNTLKSYISLSTGDLLVASIDLDTEAVTLSLIDINQIPGEQVAPYFSSGSLSKIYFAAPSSGSVSIINALTDEVIRTLF